MACRAPQREREAALSEQREQRATERASLRRRVKAAREEGLSWAVIHARFSTHSLSHLQTLAAEPEEDASP